MTQEQIIKGLSEIRKALGPVLNDRYKNILAEAQSMLDTSSVKKVPKEKKLKPSFNQLVAKYYFKQA